MLILELRFETNKLNAQSISSQGISILIAQNLSVAWDAE
jgi:hypothetical protein